MTTTKSTTKSTTKKTTAKKSEKTDFSTFTVTGTELASILGLTLPNITQMKLNGNLVPDADGKFNLKESVSSYCKRMREKKEGKQSKSDIDTETAIWKLQAIKIKNRDWRMQRDRQIGTEILTRLTNAMTAFREQAKLNPALVTAIDELVAQIGSVSVDDVSTIVEGDELEDDE